MEEYMLPCFNKKYLGFECLGCGIQRSLAFILQGDFIAAFKMYPAIYTLILLFGLIAIHAVKNIKYGNKIITVLAILNGFIIITSFIIKTFITN
ncbi:DUF2752 domain-containing protein [Tamlana sp. s12]|uniref:DUF2752 domain-containing protein n=1 Tax=Flavobacteriaceae TaxID=49546 RepID=UPI0007FC122F|nr:MULTISPECIES: DUF2752 domain-containing protein [Tamlana]OBQ56635.1 hypothetical protein VQ01_04655 [Tamlana sp. s12]QQY81723.1 DUF2752 domain-containing protein [Tamlana sp. s12]